MLNYLHITALSLTTQQKYSGYTLIELLVVMSIVVVLGAMTFSSFGGLQNTVKMNEYTLTLEQNIQSVQRASMLLERKTGESWLYGLGIDLRDMGSDGKYTVFKWCSTFSDYGNILTKSDLPNYTPLAKLGVPTGSERNGYLPDELTIGENGTCPAPELATGSSLELVSGYETSTVPPKASITVNVGGNDTLGFVVFESVSGRAFFYSTSGELLNYDVDGKLLATPSPLVITINPDGNGSTKTISISNLSGKVTTNTL